MMKSLKYINLAFFALTIIINALANLMPFGGGNTGEISAKYPNLFTPAPITFSIWGIIYLMVAFFIFYQFGLLNHAYADSFVRLAGYWFIISCVMNIGWIFSWHFDAIWLSMVFMVGLLLSLIILTIRISPIAIMSETDTKSIPLLARLCMYGFDIYLGWICAATIANLSVLLVKMNWDRFSFSEEFWTVIVLLVGAILGILFIFMSRRYMSALAIIWAYCGILIKHIDQNGYAGSHPLIIIVTLLSISIILAAGIVRMLMDRFQNRM